MKSFIKYFLIVIVAFLLGATAMNLLELHARPTLQEVHEALFLTEQMFLASQAERNGDKIRTVIYRYNVAEAESGGKGFSIFTDKTVDNSFWSTFSLILLGKMKNACVLDKAAKITEGIDRGKLAIAFDKAGYGSEAQKQWILAQTLMNKKSIEETREFIFNLHGIEKTELHKKAEDAVLGSFK